MEPLIGSHGNHIDWTLRIRGGFCIALLNQTFYKPMNTDAFLKIDFIYGHEYALN